MSLKADIEYAIHEHSAWKTRFRDFLWGKTDVDVPSIGEPGHCQFGKWLEEDGCKLLLQDDLNEIRRLHLEFHHAAAGVIHKIKQKNFAGARSDLAGEGAFNQASHALITCLLKVSLHSAQLAPAPTREP